LSCELVLTFVGQHEFKVLSYRFLFRTIPISNFHAQGAALPHITSNIYALKFLLPELSLLAKRQSLLALDLRIVMYGMSSAYIFVQKPL
jgi:hypothetical protein